MRNITQDSKPEPKSNIIAREIEDEMILYNPEEDQVHLLNTTAAAVYDLCDGSNTVKDIIGILRANMPFLAIDIEKDVLQLLSSLSEKGILKD